jgi:hypothetical protein
MLTAHFQYTEAPERERGGWPTQMKGASFSRHGQRSRARSATLLQWLPPSLTETQYKWCINRTIDTILHDVLLEIHQEEKIMRMQTAVVEIVQKAEKIAKQASENDGQEAPDKVETNAATMQDDDVQLKGNPMVTVKHIRCPRCKLRRLLYPRVGYNSRPPPDPTEQYCKNEPMIIIDKHDVHGQRKKGVKGVGKAQNKKKGKKNDPGSPAASQKSDPDTPSSSMPAESFELKEIDVPAAKCPNRDSRLGDHWKSVNVFATHLNGNCYLKRDRAAGREANSKIAGTPRDSRANSPKPATNGGGVKRKAEDDDKSTGSGPSKNKKQKLTPSDTKKPDKKAPPSKLKEVDNASDAGSLDTRDAVDTIQVTPTKREASNEPAIKLKLKNNAGAGDGNARKKPSKPGKK